MVTQSRRLDEEGVCRYEGNEGRKEEVFCDKRENSFCTTPQTG